MVSIKFRENRFGFEWFPATVSKTKNGIEDSADGDNIPAYAGKELI
jgi:hypothetical protein